MSNLHHRIQSVQAQAPHVLALHFQDGLQASIDLSQTIQQYRSLRPLLDAGVFATAAVGEFGASVIWNNSDALELAADNLRAMAFEQQGYASNRSLIEWMARNGLTLDAAAQELGLSRRMLAYYRSGEKPLPRTVALACKGWEAERHALAA